MELFSNQDQTRQLIIEERLISDKRLMQENYNKIWLTVLTWILTVHSGGIIAILGYWAQSKIPNCVDCMHNSFKTFIAGLILALLCLAANFITARMLVKEYITYTNNIINNRIDINEFNSSKCCKFIDWTAWPTGIFSFLLIFIGIFYGCKAINLFSN